MREYISRVGERHHSVRNHRRVVFEVVAEPEEIDGDGRDQADRCREGAQLGDTAAGPRKLRPQAGEEVVDRRVDVGLQNRWNRRPGLADDVEGELLVTPDGQQVEVVKQQAELE